MLALTDAVTVDDLPAVIVPLILSIGDQLSVGDDPIVIMPLIVALTDALTIEDLQRVAGPLGLSVTDTVGVDDLPRVFGPLPLNVTDTVGVSDQPRVAGPMTLGVSDTIGIVDQTQVAGPLSIGITEPVTLSDDPMTFGPPFLAWNVTLQGVVPGVAFGAANPTVDIYPFGSATPFSTPVTSSGIPEFSNAFSGNWRIVVRADGFVPVELQNLLIDGQTVFLPPVVLRAGRIDSDGVVSIRDISAAAAMFGQTVVARIDGEGRFVDVNGDGVVDILDISAIASNFGLSGSIPWPGVEPSPSPGPPGEGPP
jgi:hypothetical protein